MTDVSLPFCSLYICDATFLQSLFKASFQCVAVVFCCLVNGLHLYGALLILLTTQRVVHRKPAFTYSCTHWETGDKVYKAWCRLLTKSQDQTLTHWWKSHQEPFCSVSCWRTFWHRDCKVWGRPTDLLICSNRPPSATATPNHSSWLLGKRFRLKLTELLRAAVVKCDRQWKKRGCNRTVNKAVNHIKKIIIFFFFMAVTF